MRDRLLRLEQAAGDHLAHAVVRHFLVAAGLEELLDRLVRGACRHRRSSGRSRGRLGSGGAAAAGAGADAAGAVFAVPPSIAARTSRSTMRPCGPEPRSRRDVDAGVLGDAPCERRGEHPLPVDLRNGCCCRRGGSLPGRGRRGSWKLAADWDVILPAASCDCGAAAAWAAAGGAAAVTMSPRSGATSRPVQPAAGGPCPARHGLRDPRPRPRSRRSAR